MKRKFFWFHYKMEKYIKNVYDCKNNHLKIKIYVWIHARYKILSDNWQIYRFFITMNF